MSGLQITTRAVAVAVAAENCGDLAERHTSPSLSRWVGDSRSSVCVGVSGTSAPAPTPPTSPPPPRARGHTAQRADRRVRTTKLRLRGECRLRGVCRQKRVAASPPPIGHSASALAVDLAVGRPLCGRGRLRAPVGTTCRLDGRRGRGKSLQGVAVRSFCPGRLLFQCESLVCHSSYSGVADGKLLLRTVATPPEEREVQTANRNALALPE